LLLRKIQLLSVWHTDEARLPIVRLPVVSVGVGIFEREGKSRVEQVEAANGQMRWQNK
jgi:hypothetical protein